MDMLSILKITKGYHSVKTVDGVTVPIFCKKSDNASYFYTVL